MKDTPQDSQTFDAAFDARCRELLQSRSVPAPDLVEPVLPASNHGRRLALVAGAFIAIGIGAALWPSGQPEALKAPIEAPAVASPATELTTEAHSAEEAVAQPDESDAMIEVQEEEVAVSERGIEAAEMTASSAESEVSSPDMDLVSSGLGTAESTTEPTTEPTTDAVESAESAEATIFEEGHESSQGDPAGSPSEEPDAPVIDEPAAAPEPAIENEEPTLRLPLTLPAGGGH